MPKTKNKLNMLIMNILIVIDHFDKKITILQILVPKLKCAPIFMKFGT